MMRATLAPEAPEELRLREEPMRLTNVLIGELPLRIGWHLGDIRIDRQAAVRRPASSIDSGSFTHPHLHI